MKEYCKEVFEEVFDMFCESLVHTFIPFCELLIRCFIIVTFPIWAIPYAIYNFVKESEWDE